MTVLKNTVSSVGQRADQANTGERGLAASLQGVSEGLIGYIITHTCWTLSCLGIPKQWSIRGGRRKHIQILR